MLVLLQGWCSMNELDRNFTADLTRAFKEHKIFFVILGAGLFLRIAFIHFQGLSNDELSAWYRLRFDTWGEFWTNGVAKGDMHPGLYQLFMKLWSFLFGQSEWAIRSLSLLFYVANSALIQLISNRFYRRQTGWIVNAVYAVFTFMVIHTTFSRPYNSGVFFLLLSWLMILEQLKRNDFSLGRVLLLTAGFCGAMYSHYFAFLVAAVLGCISLFFVNRQSTKYVLISAFLSCLLFLPHLPVTMVQLQKGGLGWLAPPGWSWGTEVAFILFNRSWVLTILMLFLIFFPVFRWKKINDKIHFSLPMIVAFASILLGVALSYTVTPIMRELVLLFVLPFVLIPAIASWPIELSTSWSKAIFIGGMVLIGWHSILVNGVFRPIHFGVFRELGDELNSFDKLCGRRNIACAMNLNDEAYLNYYLKHKRKSLVTDWYAQNVREELNQKAKNSSSKYFCYVFNSAYDQPVFREIISRYYPIKISERVFPGSAIYLFAKGTRRKWSRPIKMVSNKWKSSNREFDFNTAVKVSELHPLKSFDYYTFVFKLERGEEDTRIISVVTLTRNGKPVIRNGVPLFYESIEQNFTAADSSESNCTMPFFLPENALPDDELLFYLWNPDKGTYKATEAAIYTVE